MTSQNGAPMKRPKLTAEQIDAAMPEFLRIGMSVLIGLAVAMIILAVCKYGFGWK